MHGCSPIGGGILRAVEATLIYIRATWWRCAAVRSPGSRVSLTLWNDTQDEGSYTRSRPSGCGTARPGSGCGRCAAVDTYGLHRSTGQGRRTGLFIGWLDCSECRRLVNSNLNYVCFVY